MATKIYNGEVDWYDGRILWKDVNKYWILWPIRPIDH